MGGGGGLQVKFSLLFNPVAEKLESGPGLCRLSPAGTLSRRPGGASRSKRPPRRAPRPDGAGRERRGGTSGRGRRRC